MRTKKQREGTRLGRSKNQTGREKEQGLTAKTMTMTTQLTLKMQMTDRKKTRRKKKRRQTKTKVRVQARKVHKGKVCTKKIYKMSST
jgi:hypothetical protein